MLKETKLSRKSWLFLAMVCLISLMTAGSAEAAKTCHLIVVADTNDKQIGPSTGIDAFNVEMLFRNNVASNQLKVHVLRDRSVTRNGILNRISSTARNMDRDDTIIVFFAGHGAEDGREGHYIALSSGESVLRSELLRNMSVQDVRLKVLITDTCSVMMRRREMAAPSAAEPGTHRTSLAFTELCWKPSGTVDISSSSRGEVAMGDNTVGGYFTDQFTQYLTKNADRSNVNWASVANNVRVNTSRFFSTRHPQGVSIPGQGKQYTQTVYARINLSQGNSGNTAPPSNNTPPPSDNKGPRFGVRVVEDGERGVLIKEVHRGSPGTNVRVEGISGNVSLESGDRILSINNRAINSESAYSRAINNSGQHMHFEVRNYRDGRTYSASVNLRY